MSGRRVAGARVRGCEGRSGAASALNAGGTKNVGAGTSLAGLSDLSNRRPSLWQRAAHIMYVLYIAE